MTDSPKLTQQWEPYPGSPPQAPRTFQSSALSCSEVRGNLERFMRRDPSLEAQRVQHISDHVQLCQTCRAALFRLRHAAGMLPSLEDLNAANPDVPPKQAE